MTGLAALPLPVAKSEATRRGVLPDRATPAFEAWRRGNPWDFPFKCGGPDGPYHRVRIHADGRVEFPDHRDTTDAVLSTIAGPSVSLTCLKIEFALESAWDTAEGCPPGDYKYRQAGDYLAKFVRGRGTVGRILGPLLRHVVSRGVVLVPPRNWPAGHRSRPGSRARGTHAPTDNGGETGE